MYGNITDKTITDLLSSYGEIFGLQCFDTVGWAAGRASGL